jgi:hypothetical protein
MYQTKILGRRDWLLFFCDFPFLSTSVLILILAEHSSLFSKAGAVFCWYLTLYWMMFVFVDG